MKRIARIMLLALGAAGLLCGQVSAFDMDDIEIWAGDPNGTNKAVMVIEWREPEIIDPALSDVDAPNDEICLAWGYKFNGSKTGEDMFNAILAADPRLFAMVSGTTQYGKAVFALGYDADDDGEFEISDGSTTYDQDDFTNGLVTGSYNDPDYFNVSGGDDVYWGGWYGPNWELWHEGSGYSGNDCPDRGVSTYWTKTDQYGWSGYHGEWTFSQTGMSGMNISNGSWMGWSVAAAGLEWGDPDSENTIAWINNKVAPDEPVAAED